MNTLFTTLNVSYSKYFNNFIGDQSGYQFLIDNSITDYTAKGNIEWFVDDALTFKGGFESSKYQFTYLQNFTGNTDSTKQGSSGGSTNLTKEDWQHSLFAQLKWSITELFSIQSGLRINYWDLSNLITYDPRISLRYRFTENICVESCLRHFSPEFETCFATLIFLFLTLGFRLMDRFLQAVQIIIFLAWKLNLKKVMI